MAIVLERTPVSLPELPDEYKTVGFWAGAGAGLAALLKTLGDAATARATRAKLAAEAEAARALAAKSEAERSTAEVLGEKAAEEARLAGVETLSQILAEMRLQLDETSARAKTTEEQLDQVRRHFLGFRGAVLQFITTLTGLLPQMTAPVRARVSEALAELQQHKGWDA